MVVQPLDNHQLGWLKASMEFSIDGLELYIGYGFEVQVIDTRQAKVVRTVRPSMRLGIVALFPQQTGKLRTGNGFGGSSSLVGDGELPAMFECDTRGGDVRAIDQTDRSYVVSGCNSENGQACAAILLQRDGHRNARVWSGGQCVRGPWEEERLVSNVSLSANADALAWTVERGGEQVVFWDRLGSGGTARRPPKSLVTVPAFDQVVCFEGKSIVRVPHDKAQFEIFGITANGELIRQRTVRLDNSVLAKGFVSSGMIWQYDGRRTEVMALKNGGP